MNNHPKIQRGQIYLINMQGLSDFAEDSGRIKDRPGLVVSTNIVNRKNSTVTVALLTSQYKVAYAYMGTVTIDGNPSYIKYERIITVPRGRLLRLLATVDDVDQPALDMKLMAGLGISKYCMSDISDFEVAGIQRGPDGKGHLYIEIKTFYNKSWTAHLPLEAFTAAHPEVSDLEDYQAIHDVLNNCAGLHFLFSSFSCFDQESKGGKLA